MNIYRKAHEIAFGWIFDRNVEWMENWKKVHVVLRDNGPNMVKATNTANLKNVSCFSHTLQLIIHDAILCQPLVAELITSTCRIVGHFKHSLTACARLHEIQWELGLPEHQLCQDVVTRWNSTFYMLDRLAEQKCVISLFSAEAGDQDCRELNLRQVSGIWFLTL